jgi:hypothetical protein
VFPKNCFCFKTFFLRQKVLFKRTGLRDPGCCSWPFLCRKLPKSVVATFGASVLHSNASTINRFSIFGAFTDLGQRRKHFVNRENQTLCGRLRLVATLFEWFCSNGFVRMVLFEWFCSNGFVQMVLFEWFCSNGFVRMVLFEWFCLNGFVRMVLLKCFCSKPLPMSCVLWLSFKYVQKYFPICIDLNDLLFILFCDV